MQVQQLERALAASLAANRRLSRGKAVCQGRLKKANANMAARMDELQDSAAGFHARLQQAQAHNVQAAAVIVGLGQQLHATCQARAAEAPSADAQAGAGPQAQAAQPPAGGSPAPGSQGGPGWAAGGPAGRAALQAVQAAPVQPMPPKTVHDGLPKVGLFPPAGLRCAALAGLGSSPNLAGQLPVCSYACVQERQHRWRVGSEAGLGCAGPRGKRACPTVSTCAACPRAACRCACSCGGRARLPHSGSSPDYLDPAGQVGSCLLLLCPGHRPPQATLLPSFVRELRGLHAGCRATQACRCCSPLLQQQPHELPDLHHLRSCFH